MFIVEVKFMRSTHEIWILLLNQSHVIDVRMLFTQDALAFLSGHFIDYL